MKVERHAGLHVDAKATAAPPASWDATGTRRTFETALRDQRQRIAPGGNDSKRLEPRAARPRANEVIERTDRERPSTGVASQRPTPSVDRRQAPPPPDHDSPLAAFIDRSLAARWRRAANHRGPACIEVIHAASQSRFLLSREDGVWLLSIQSRASPPNDEALVLALRELFARQGLGPLDVVKL